MHPDRTRRSGACVTPVFADGVESGALPNIGFEYILLGFV